MDESIQKDLDILIKICHANLANSSKCLSYLKETRGLSDEAIEKYQIGFFPQNVEMLFKYISRATLEKLSIVDYSISGSSKFSEYFYLIFPIFSEYKKAIGIGGRTLLSDSDREILGLPKYKNSSFKKAHFLYGLQNSRGAILKKKNVFITEGYFDQIAFDTNEIKNSVAICGTAFSRYHLLKLARYTDRLSFILDGDDGGMKSMERVNKKYYNCGLKLDFYSLPKEYKDVDQYFSSENTKDSFVNEIKQYKIKW